MEEYKRNCPTCNKEIFYKSQWGALRGEKLKTICENCSRNKWRRGEFDLTQPIAGKRNCPICKKELIYVKKNSFVFASGRNSVCDSCLNKKYKTPEINRKIHLQYKYGISLEDYNILFDKQTGKCQICNKHQSELNSPLAVDHCHKTNLIRGLLCMKCNTGIGSLEDDIKILENAIIYLKSQNS